MQYRRLYITVIFSLLLAASLPLGAQDGTYNGYTPYSVYGIGDIATDGTAATRSMGGIGVAMRDRRIMNIMNPAAVTARDSLSFMADFGMSGTNSVFTQGDLTSGHNTFNINNFALSFPIYKSSAMMVGIKPMSNMGYDFSSLENNPMVIAHSGDISYKHKGVGGTYQVFADAGVTLWNALSLGVEGTYYFGAIDKATQVEFNNTAYRSISSGYKMNITGATLGFGAQWDIRIKGNNRLTLGASYQLESKMKGNVDDYTIASISSLVDTLSFNSFKLGDKYSPTIPARLRVGLSFTRGDRWMAEIDYTRSDWTTCGFDDTPGLGIKGANAFAAAVSQEISAGFQFTPNRYDTRYYLRRCTYRGGAYYKKSHFQLNGNDIDAFGLTFGVTLPVWRYYNGVTFGVDLGQKGSVANNGTRERYATFNVSFNLHDLWFIKYRYE